LNQENAAVIRLKDGVDYTTLVIPTHKFEDMTNFEDANNATVRGKAFLMQSYIPSRQMGGKDPLQIYNVGLHAHSSTRAGPNVLVMHATEKVRYEDDGMDEDGKPKPRKKTKEKTWYKYRGAQLIKRLEKCYRSAIRMVEIYQRCVVTEATLRFIVDPEERIWLLRAESMWTSQKPKSVAPSGNSGSGSGLPQKALRVCPGDFCREKTESGFESRARMGEGSPGKGAAENSTGIMSEEAYQLAKSQHWICEEGDEAKKLNAIMDRLAQQHGHGSPQQQVPFSGVG